MSGRTGADAAREHAEDRVELLHEPPRPVCGTVGAVLVAGVDVPDLSGGNFSLQWEDGKLTINGTPIDLTAVGDAYEACEAQLPDPADLPDLPGLRFQAVHTADIAEAYRLAALTAVRGAFNIAAEPIVDAAMLADIFGARTVAVPLWPVRAALWLAWQLHLIPASPYLFDAFLRLPIMDITRAWTELGWSPRYSSREALEEFLGGLRDSAGMSTPPLAPKVAGGRSH